MNKSLEVIGEGRKVIVLRKIDLEEEKRRIYFNNSKYLCEELNIINYDSHFANIIFFFTYFHLFKHIHFYSNIFVKNSVIKVVKNNETKNLNITLQHNWVKRLSYKKSKIFDNSFFTYNNFVIFHPYFAEIIRKTIDLYNNKKKKTTNKILTNKRNSDKIIENKFTKIKNLLKYISVKNIFNLKENLLKYFRKLSYNILQYTIIFFSRKLKKISNEKKKNKYVFREIYDSHDFIYCSNSNKNDFGYLEENLFYIPSYILGNTKDHKINTILNNKRENKNEEYLNDIIHKKRQKNILKYNFRNDVLNSSKHNINGICKIGKIYNNKVVCNNDKKNMKNLVGTYISIELKLKCGISDYKNMFDRYNIQQLIKKKNQNKKYLSLYIPSNFFNLRYWDILTNLYYIFLFKSNNINFYINDKKHKNTSLYFFNYLYNFFSYYSFYLLPNNSYEFYFNYLNYYRKQNTGNILFYNLEKKDSNIYKSEIKHLRDKLSKSESINNLMRYCKKCFYLNEKKCYAVNENNLKNKLNFNSGKENVYKNNKLENFEYNQMKRENVDDPNLIKAFHKSFFFIHLFNLLPKKKKKNVNEKCNICHINENNNIKIFKKKSIKVKKHYKKFYSLYKKVSKKFKKKISVVSKHELGLKKNIYKKIKEKANKSFLYKINKKLYYLYDKKFNKKCFFNLLMLYKLNIIKKYVNNFQYYIIFKIKEIKILFQKKIYKQVNESINCFFNKLSNIFNKKKKISKYEGSDNKEILGDIDSIKNFHYSSSKIKGDPFEININNESLLIISCIIRKEKYLFYKLLYFQCFNAGQVQLIYCMMKFIKIFEEMFDLRKSDEYFTNFKYYKKSLNNIFNVNTNYYFKKNKYLLHVLDIKKIKRLTDYIFNSKKKKKKNIKYSSFIYLQNSHFILGNEILIDAMNMFNEVTDYKFNDLRIELKKNTRKLYMKLCKQKSYKKREYCYRYNSKKNIYKKQVIQEVLSKESLATFDHFYYLTNESFANIFRNINYSKKKKINKKIMCIYKNMIYFICRFLMSKTFCDNSTIFNIYYKNDNVYDHHTTMFLKNNRFKLLILNKTNRNITSRKNYNTKEFSEGSEDKYNSSYKMKKKYITKNIFSSYLSPFLKIHLKRKKLRYINKINKELKKMVINRYIKEKNKKIYYRISLIDLPIKPINKINYWTKQMGDIISTYKDFCVN
ncbi:conserved Plasmodium protein, unknown function [Plasmodium relictum]|uniref:Uncharacterized protein n=1 Tax=Plasmodium relictum TaxID=85471 RepID=A0A1J1H0T8_PLARL|nr:conserved Plasmodium protein, unknown function [Plasmodium relictum]CRG98405.1 conserved Plasmodium protein, unknown function [Plasmodium relictum]